MLFEFLCVLFKLFLIVFALREGFARLQLIAHLFGLLPRQGFEAFSLIDPSDALRPLLTILPHYKSLSELLPTPAKGLDELLLGPEDAGYHLSVGLGPIVDEFGDLLQGYGYASDMNLLSAGLASPVAAPESDLAVWVGTHLDYPFPRCGTDNVGILLSEAVEHGLELLVGVVLPSFLHCAQIIITYFITYFASVSQYL